MTRTTQVATRTTTRPESRTRKEPAAQSTTTMTKRRTKTKIGWQRSESKTARHATLLRRRPAMPNRLSPSKISRMQRQTTQSLTKTPTTRTTMRPTPMSRYLQIATMTTMAMKTTTTRAPVTIARDCPSASAVVDSSHSLPPIERPAIVRAWSGARRWRAAPTARLQ